MVLKKLCNLPGISGHENQIREYIRNEITNFADEIKVDCLGNLMVKKRGHNCSKIIMFLAHMDEVGFIVEKIESSGIIKFSSVGGILPTILPATAVTIHGKKTISGVMGIMPIHLQKNSIMEPIKMDSLYIDVGASSDKDLQDQIQVGDPIVFRTSFEDYGHLWKAKAIDDRVGCSIMMEMLKQNIIPEYDTWFVFATQEEVGLRGSKTATYQIKPDFSIVLEGTTACDVPLVERNRYTTQLGFGPAISIAHHGFMFSKKVFDYLKSVAENHQIPYQIKEKIAGGNDATSVATGGKGSYVGSLSVPVRYIHSPVSLMHPDDYQTTLQLSLALYQENQTFFNS